MAHVLQEAALLRFEDTLAECMGDIVQDLVPGVQSGYLDSCESLRTVWLWDEDYVDPELVDSLSGALPDAQIFQGFDQAECAFFVTLLPLTGGDDQSQALHGQPLPNIRVCPHCCAALCAPVGKGKGACMQGPLLQYHALSDFRR